MSTLQYRSKGEYFDLFARDLNEAHALIGSLLVSFTELTRAPDVYSVIIEKLGCLIASLIPGKTMRVFGQQAVPRLDKSMNLESQSAM